MARVWHVTMGLKPHLTPAYVALALMAGVASAQPVAGPAVEVFANSLGRPHEGTVVIPADVLVGTDGVYSWELSQPREILSRSDGLTVVGIINSLSVSFESSENNPAVEMIFDVDAMGTDTKFSIATGSLFAGVREADALATADALVEDRNANGASMIDIIALGLYNENKENWGIIVHEDLIASPDSFTTLERFRPIVAGEREVLPSSIDRISASFLFTLSANDSGHGRVRFDVVPEPTSLSLLAFGGLALWRLRRRRA